jgi:hypothetical protein
MGDQLHINAHDFGMRCSMSRCPHTFVHVSVYVNSSQYFLSPKMWGLRTKRAVISNPDTDENSLKLKLTVCILTSYSLYNFISKVLEQQQKWSLSQYFLSSLYLHMLWSCEGWLNSGKEDVLLSHYVYRFSRLPGFVFTEMFILETVIRSNYVNYNL